MPKLATSLSLTLIYGASLSLGSSSDSVDVVVAMIDALLAETKTLLSDTWLFDRKRDVTFAPCFIATFGLRHPVDWLKQCVTKAVR